MFLESRGPLVRSIVSLCASVALATLAFAAPVVAQEAAEFTYLNLQGDPTRPVLLNDLATNYCAAENAAMPLKIDFIPNEQLDQRIQLLGGQNALPTLFPIGNSPSLGGQLLQSGLIMDLEPVLKEQGVWDQLLPAAAETVKSLYGGKMNALPWQINIEGFWYNKVMFAERGLEVPETFDDLLAIAETFKNEGIVPFSVGASNFGWPLTRYVANYLYRTVGPNALIDVRDGNAKLTDPAYVKAAQVVQDMGKAGYFGTGLESIDYTQMVNNFMTSKSPMLFNGSWVVGQFVDPAQNPLGTENIGFFSFPDVEGGNGSRAHLAANVGIPAAVATASYNENVAAWIKCLATNVGEASLKVGTLSGFRVNGTVEVDPLTQVVQDQINAATTTVLWFEALFNSKASASSWNNAAAMVSGSMSPEDFMALVQADQ